MCPAALAANSRWIRWLPMKPAPPVTRVVMPNEVDCKVARCLVVVLSILACHRGSCRLSPRRRPRSQPIASAQREDDAQGCPGFTAVDFRRAVLAIGKRDGGFSE